MQHPIYPEIVYASDEPEVSRRISSAIKDGKLRPLVPRVYTSNMEEEDQEILRRNVWMIIGRLFPGALISHRSAFEYRISPLDNIYLTYTYREVLRWPGVNIRMAEGPPNLVDDPPMY